ncbi:MAG: phage holin family protein [Pseudomonadota bacterium]|uniref:phage holin family protein n=1 Tax=Thermithiobacillus tepidarius TaxID=929 RepID=UPI00040C1FA8|nr:phage holin family protein [Thermithiobacillus tepidarius]
MQVTTKDERSLASLFKELTGEMSLLVRKEVELAKVETTEKVTQAGAGLASLAVGGAVAFAGFLVLLAALVLGLGQVMALWLAALIVGVVVLGIGFMLLQKGRDNLKAQNLTPRRTVESLRRDKQFAKEQMT